MCVLSMVYDYYQPQFDKPLDVADLTKALDEFRKATEAAKTVDNLTGQPDCVDPEKAKLDERIKELEAQQAKTRVLIGYRIKRADGMYANGSYRWVIRKAAFLFTDDDTMTGREWAYGHKGYLHDDCHVVGVYRRTKP